MKKRLAVAFTGPSNSGKTTLIIKCAEILMQKHGKKVAIVKHDPKDKAKFDVEGKDSYRFSQTGAEVVVTSPERTTYFSQQHKEIDEIIGMFSDSDIVLVEGLKELALPRIAVFRNQFDESYTPYIKALATDGSFDVAKINMPKEIDILELNNTDQIIDWILTHAKEV